MPMNMAKSARKKKKKKVRKVKLSPWQAVLAAAAVLAVVFLVFRRWNGYGSESGASVPAGTWRYGIDISHNNEGPIVWDSLFVMTDAKRKTIRDPYQAKEIRKVSFIFIKASEGVTMKDKDFDRNWKAAGRADIRRGAYHFFRSSKDGRAQAENFIRSVGSLRHSDLPPVLDIETIHRGCSKKELNDKALVWLKTVEEHYGKKPVVYTGAAFARDVLSDRITSEYPLWIAHYGVRKPAFDGWTWWQFTDKAVVKGVPGKVDLNVMAVEQP